jgi:hypothetical protein
VLLALVSQIGIAEEAETEIEQEQTNSDADNDLLKAAQERALERKKMQIPGYQAFTVAGQEIDGTYLEEITGEKHGIVIFFHDNNQQLETPSVVTPLRQMLPEYGWSTISFAMDYLVENSILLSASTAPEAEAELATDEGETASEEVADTNANANEVVMADDVETEEPEQPTLPPVSNEERVQAIISFVQAKDYSRIVFIGHGEGAEIAATIMAPLDTGIDALLLVDANDFVSYEAYEKIFKPVIDIYPQQASDRVKLGVQKRKKMAKLNPKTIYMAREVIGANYLFYGFEARLAKIIRSILHKQFLAENEE